MASLLIFNLKDAAIYQAVFWENTFIFRFVKLLKKIFFLFLIIFSGTFFYGFFADVLSTKTLSQIFGAILLFIVLYFIEWLKEGFLNLKLKNPRLKITIEEANLLSKGVNVAEFLDFDSAKFISQTIKFVRSKKFSEVSSSHLFYFLVRGSEKLNFIFGRALLDSREIKKILEAYFKITKREGFKEIFSQDFQDTILEALQIAQKKEHSRIEVGDILSALSKHDAIFKKILIDNNLKTEDIENLAWWMEDLTKKIKFGKKFWEWKNLIRQGSIGKEWAAGYTLTLDKFGIDLSKVVAKQGFPEIIGHQREIKQMERILSRRETNNVLLVGEPGSGRKSMIYALAEKSVLGESLPEVNHKRVIQLDLPYLLTQIQSTEKIESILDAIFRETVSAGNVILVIDEIHNFIGGPRRPGVIDISGVIAPYLPLPTFQIVGITTFEGFHKNIEPQTAILSLFEKVEVAEISERETLMLLEDLSLRLESKYKKFISYPSLRNLIVFCDRYLAETPFPEKAMDLLDETMVYLAQTNDKVLLSEHVAKIISEKTQIPVGEIEFQEREVLLNLETLIHQRIVDQEEAVREVSAALRRARAEITVRKGPMGTFLFLGPTGVGKTETAKAIAEIYFGSENRMIRLDMSEFQNVEDLARLLASSAEEGILTTKVRENPFSLILLDEIEKAHPNVLNLFLQVLDEGHLTDSMGRKIDFKNTIIIATSNAGYQVILDAIKEKWKEWFLVKDKLLNYLFDKGIFRPEFINRFDGVIVFRPLSKENILAVVELMLQKLKKNLREKEIEFIITSSLKEKLVDLGYNPTFGARELRRTVQDKIENALAEGLLAEKIKRGDKVEINPHDFTLLIK